MKIVWVSALPLLIALNGCAEILKKQATEKLEAQCAAMGKQFFQKHAAANEYLVGATAEVSGECIDPSDPRYVHPAQPLKREAR